MHERTEKQMVNKSLPNTYLRDKMAGRVEKEIINRSGPCAGLYQYTWASPLLEAPALILLRASVRLYARITVRACLH